MSLSGALTSAVTGIDAQSIALGSISDNISNSGTTGYKRVETEFSTLLTVSNALVHEPGGVTSKPLYTNDIQGTIQQTGISTNLAVSNSGFFAVSQALGSNSSNALPTFAPDPLFTRAGDFSLDNNGFLVNNGGYFLNGFQINQTTGAVEKNALVPIRLNELKSNPLATANITYSANLPTSPAANLNVGSATPVTTGQNIAFSSPAASYADGNTLDVTQTALNGTTTTQTFFFTDTAGGNTPAPAGDIQVNFDSTTPLATQVAALQTALATAGPGGSPIPNSFAAGTNTLTIGSAANATPPTVTAAVLGGTPFGSGTATVTNDTLPANLQFAPTVVNFFDAQGAAHPVNVTWTKVSGTNDTYEVSYGSTDPTITGITPATPTLVQFNVQDNLATGAKAGSILSVGGVAGAVGTAAAIPLAVSFGGTTPVTQDVSFGLGNFGVAQQTTLFTGTDVNFISAQQDGLPPGSFRNLDIDTHGNITLNFDNGARKTEFQIPLVQFSNFDGLQPQNGNAFSTTVASGTPSINSPGDNGTGTIVASSVEGSNVDIAAEFTKLIQTQRAYEANTKVVTTTDTLLQLTDNLIR
jgi:flagellar hook protein FlgE